MSYLIIQHQRLEGSENSLRNVHQELKQVHSTSGKGKCCHFSVWTNYAGEAV